MHYFTHILSLFIDWVLACLSWNTDKNVNVAHNVSCDVKNGIWKITSPLNVVQHTFIDSIVMLEWKYLHS